MIHAAATTVELFRAAHARLRVLLAYPGFLGFCLMVVTVALILHTGFALQDEPSEWYGAQRVLGGDIPLRDFNSYDPARYYWSAAVMYLLRSHGLIAFRVSLGLCAGLALWLTNRLVFRKRVPADPWLLLMVSISFLLWMMRLYKIFDVAASIILVMSLAWLLEQPTQRRFFVHGLVVGAIAIVGRNHGLYGAVAGAAGLAFVVWAERRAPFWPSALSWSAGILAGYAPMLIAVALVPGFWTGLWASIRVYFEIGGTRYPAPFLWPWRVDLGAPLVQILRDFCTSFLLMGLPLFGIGGVAYSLWRVRSQKRPADSLLLAAALTALPYTHHGYEGLGHLEQAIHPMLIGMFALIVEMPRRRAYALATAACTLSVFLLVPGTYVYLRATDGNPWPLTRVGTDTLHVDPFIARRVDVLDDLVAAYAPGNREFVAEPFIPAAYPLSDRRAAVWNQYALFPADTAVQEAEIKRIQAERPSFVLIVPSPHPYAVIDPLVYGFINRNFVRTADPAIPPQWGWELYLPSAQAAPQTRGPAGRTQVE